MKRGTASRSTERKYVAIRDAVLERIRTGQYRPGVPVHSERALAAEFGVAPMTVRRAILEIVDQGLLVRKSGRGNGTFVRAVNRKGPGRGHAAGLRRVGFLNDQSWEETQRDPVKARLAMEIQACMNSNGIGLELLPQPNAGGGERLADRALAAGCQALVAISWPDLGDLENAQARGIPVVAAGPFMTEKPVSWVASHEIQGARDVTRRLLGLGYREVAVVAPGGDYSVRTQRLLGWRLAQPQVTDPERLAYLPDSGGAPLRMADCTSELARLFAKRPPPPAIFAYDGFLASATYQALLRIGLRCPADVSLVCMNRYYEGLLDMPRVTHAETPVGALGRAVLRLIEDHLSRRHDMPTGIVLPMAVVEGETTRPA